MISGDPIAVTKFGRFNFPRTAQARTILINITELYSQVGLILMPDVTSWTTRSGFIKEPSLKSHMLLVPVE